MAGHGQAFTSADMLGRILAGLTVTSGLLPGPPGEEAVPDLTADEFETEGAKVATVIRTPTGDAYRISVEWLSERSP